MSIIPAPTGSPRPCPPWCKTDHAKNAGAERRIQSREHSVDLLAIQDAGADIATVSVIACDDLPTGERSRPEVYLGCAGCLSNTDALRVADALVRAVQMVRTGQAA